MPYTTTTLADAWADMGSRLDDPSHVRWPTDELTIYIQQAIRTYNALTNHFREATTFTASNPDLFWDLPTIAPTLRGQTVTVADAVNQIAVQLLEPLPTGSTWNGTAQFSFDDILQALQQARDTFLFDTGVIVTRTEIAVPAPAGTGLVALPEAIIKLRRCAWKTADNVVIPLFRDDQWGMNSYGVGWQTASSGRPKAYSVSTQPPLEVQTAPVTTTAGTLDVIGINRGSVPTTADLTQLLGVPDDWVWVVIFGALAQLLQRDGLALDAARAAYCDARWSHGIEMAKASAVLIAGRVSGTPCILGSVVDADAYSPSWQMVPGTPHRMLTMGQTLLALWPPPGVPIGGGGYTVTLELVRNAPVPVDSTDVIQMGTELLNDVFDYAQHLALFKEGSGQTEQSMALLEQFMSLCGTSVKILNASAPNDPSTVAQTAQDAKVVAYEVP